MRTLHQHLNNQRLSIRFTREMEEEHSLAFLDVLIKKEGGKLTRTVYRKNFKDIHIWVY